MFKGVGQLLARTDSLAWNKQAEVVAAHYCHGLLVRFCIRRRLLVKGARQADLRHLKTQASEQSRHWQLLKDVMSKSRGRAEKSQGDDTVGASSPARRQAPPDGLGCAPTMASRRMRDRSGSPGPAPLILVSNSLIPERLCQHQHNTNTTQKPGSTATESDSDLEHRSRRAWYFCHLYFFLREFRF